MKKQKILSLIVFIIGIITLAVGVVFLVLDLTKGTRIQDGEYLISAKDWYLEEGEGVVWNFTDVGKGTLTTNNHINDYDFVWAIDNEKLKIETNWLYKLENEYDYTLDQNNGVLILKNGDKEIRLVADFATE